jgi:GNAT superfamily N-acetyltransferase
VSVQLRRAEAADEQAVLGLARRFVTSFELSERAFRASFAELLASRDALLLVAADGEQVLGYCLAFDHPTFYANGRVAWVEEITVREDRRGQGIGRILMDGAEACARQRGATLLALATRRAAAFYGALGYEESATYFRKLLQAP